jgi:ectoine hydroxylase-related dioxygenase (phytanoyl-CoA dioxygenase family)
MAGKDSSADSLSNGAKLVIVKDPGYWIIENVFSFAECDELVASLSAARDRHGRAGTRHLMNNPKVHAAANHPALLGIASRTLGAAAVPYRATLFEKSGLANWLVVWHQDKALPLVSKNSSAEWGPWSHKAGVLYAHAPSWALSRTVALRLHLDASTSENGPLRVIPGSHVHCVLNDKDVFALARTQSKVNCLVGRGGVLAMRPLLIHSSSKALLDLPRRVLHFEYADSRDLCEGVCLAVA